MPYGSARRFIRIPGAQLGAPRPSDPRNDNGNREMLSDSQTSGDEQPSSGVGGNSKRPSATLSFKKKLAFCTIIVSVVTCAGLIGCEIAMRLMGYPLYRPHAAQITVRPGGRFFRSDPILGFAQLPGEFEVMLRGEYTFHVLAFAGRTPSDTKCG